MNYDEIAEKICDGTASYSEIQRWLDWKERIHGSLALETAVKLLLRRTYFAEFHHHRCRQFQEWAHTLPEPYATQAFNILANGKPTP